MNAFHIFSSAPFFEKHPDKKLFIDRPEIYCTVLSALMWRKKNGKITMVTDEAGAKLFSDIGINSIWDDIKISLCDCADGIDPKTFWAGAKLFALRDMAAPCVMLDTDFIVWEKCRFADEIIAAHEEEITENIYPDISHFSLSGYTFPDNIDLHIKPLNTAFLYMPDEDFKQYYVSQSIAFMKCADQTDDPLTYMVFAEQRLLPMLAKKCKIKYTTLLDDKLLFYPQKSYTHLWGAKQVMRDNKQSEIGFCGRCIERIEADFPEYKDLILKIEHYYDNDRNGHNK